MNSSFFLQQISKTGNLDSNLISRQYKQILMADFMRVKYENPKNETIRSSKSIKLLNYYFTKI